MKKLESRTVRELIALAREWGVSGYSRLKKAELVNLLTHNLPDDLRPGEKSAAKNQAKKAGSGGWLQKARKQASRARLLKTADEKECRPAIERPDEVYEKPEVRAVSPGTTPRRRSEVGSLPTSYSDGRLGLLPRDPFWLYCFWDLSDEQSHTLWQGDLDLARLRIVEVVNGTEREVERQVLIAGATSWYINVDNAARTYRCDLGLAGQGGSFEIVMSSNLSTTPPDGVSDRVDVTLVPVGRPDMAPSGESPKMPDAESLRQADLLLALSTGEPASDVPHSAGLTRKN